MGPEHVCRGGFEHVVNSAGTAWQNRLIAPLDTAFRAPEAVAYMRESRMQGSPVISPDKDVLFIRIQSESRSRSRFRMVAGIP